MRQINFILIFLVCLGIALFCLENIEPVTIQLIPGYEVQAPLAIELILTLGVGAMLAWLFSLWIKLQRQLGALQDLKEYRDKDKRIAQLEKDLQQYKVELEKQRQSFLPTAPEQSENS